jgi:hypothetical protein
VSKFFYLVGHVAYLKAVVNGEHGKLEGLRLSSLVFASLLKNVISTAYEKGPAVSCRQDAKPTEDHGFARCSDSEAFGRSRSSGRAIDKEITHPELVELLEQMIVDRGRFFDRLNDEIVCSRVDGFSHGDLG